MDFLDRLPIPRHLSSRVWLVSLPSALVSFEKRQKVSKMPIGGLRFLGLPVVAAGVGLAVWSWRRPGATIAYSGPFSHLAKRPATAGGILVLVGTSLFLRSLVLAAYSLGLIFVTQSGQITIDDPDLDGFMGRNR